ncbi:MAG: murein transglycosylase domain-containing protein [Bacteroidota bacterium]
MRQIFAMFFAVIMMTLSLFAQDTSGANEYEKFVKQQQQGVQKEEEAFAQYKAEVTKQFDDYVSEQERLFKEYTGQIEKKWGKNHVKTSTKKEYVAYDSGFTSRKSIDFEAGQAKVEIVVTEAEAKNPVVVQQKLQDQVAELAVTKGGTDPLEKKNDIKPEKKPIIAEQLATTDGTPVTENNAKQYAAETIKKAEVTQEVVTGKDGIKRVVVGVQMPLVPNHVKKRAADFRERVKAESDRFGIDITLVYAIMHTESYFNPKAKSPVPAFGLMQLVPKSGARDAFFFAHKKDSLVTGEYLYVADNNIELGTAYLTKLLTVEFRGVKDPRSRIYCAISAYNTGPGNVAKAFTGKRNVNQALPKMNALTSDELFEHLKKNLPFEETRSYVAKVSERMGLYDEWSK